MVLAPRGSDMGGTGVQLRLLLSLPDCWVETREKAGEQRGHPRSSETIELCSWGLRKPTLQEIQPDESRGHTATRLGRATEPDVRNSWC